MQTGPIDELNDASLVDLVQPNPIALSSRRTAFLSTQGFTERGFRISSNPIVQNYKFPSANRYRTEASATQKRAIPIRILT